MSRAVPESRRQIRALQDALRAAWRKSVRFIPVGKRSEQRVNPARRERTRLQAELGIRSGRQWRKYRKAMRRRGAA